LAIPAPYLK